MILDTSIIIDLMEDNPLARQAIAQLEAKRTPIFITTPTIFELWSGLEQSGNPKKEIQKIKAAFQNQLIYDLDEKSAKEAGRIDGVLINEGERISPVDSMIAGIAKTKEKKVLTRDKHFLRIKGLAVELLP